MLTIEIVSIGNELLKGITVNTNACEIGQALFAAGFPISRQSTLPDAASLLKAALAEALTRSKVIIATGGLGPTCDDTTRQTAAELFDSPLALNQALAADLKQRYGVHPISLENQATVPVKAALLPNPIGTAPGLLFNDGSRVLILMPGVPREMRLMLHEQVIPYLTQHFDATRAAARSARFFNLGESLIDPVIRDLQSRYPEVDFGIYPSHGILEVHATVAAKNGEPIVSKVMSELKERFADRDLGAARTIGEAVRELFVQQKWSLGVAESCTGGAIAALLTKVPGASDYFSGGVVAYSNEMKTELLGVPENVITNHGAVSGETAAAMALGIVRKAVADFGVAVTGIAGPAGGTPEKPVGTVWIAVAANGGGRPACRLLQVPGSRDIIIARSANAALGELLVYCRKRMRN